MEENEPNFAKILETLTAHQVDFIVVGGICAVLLGAPVTTFDLDIVHSRSTDNLSRLHAALTEIEAYYREHLPKHLRPAIPDLGSVGHHLLLSKYGPLDVLGTIGAGDDYLALLSSTETIFLENNVPIKILDLDTLIEVKSKTARAKDKVMLEILNAMKGEG